jgi:hypothetical protein
MVLPRPDGFQPRKARHALAGLDVRVFGTVENGWLVRLGWSTTGGPGSAGTVPAPVARRIAAALIAAADEADQRNGV